LLVVTVCAQKCVQFKAIPTAGMCKDYTMNGMRCTRSSKTSDNISAEVVDRFNRMSQDECQKQMVGESSTCTSLGGKANPDVCKAGGFYCKSATLPDCATDAHCASSSVLPFYCCSAIKYQIQMLCTGVDSSAVDTLISQAKKVASNSNSISCRDTDCLEWSSASSLCTTPIILPAVALFAIATSFFGQR
jgi:hypothetical protein